MSSSNSGAYLLTFLCYFNGFDADSQRPTTIEIYNI